MARKGEFGEPVILDVDGFDVRISNPERVYFSARGETKLDLARYYEAVGPGIVNALRERPCMLHRFPDGVDGEKVHQKRLPRGAPPWVETVRLFFPRWGLHADELCVTRLADGYHVGMPVNGPDVPTTTGYNWGWGLVANFSPEFFKVATTSSSKFFK
jgi:hypothetical protein